MNLNLKNQLLTQCKFHSGVVRVSTADSRMNVTSYRTLTLSEIRYATCTNRWQPLKKDNKHEIY